MPFSREMRSGSFVSAHVEFDIVLFIFKRACPDFHFHFIRFLGLDNDRRSTQSNRQGAYQEI